MVTYFYLIAGICIAAVMPVKMKIGIESEDFLLEKSIKRVDFTIHFEPLTKIDLSEFEIVDRFETVRIYKRDQDYVKEIVDANGVPYAWFWNRKFLWQYLKGAERHFVYSGRVLNLYGLENILLRYDAFILHSSFIRWRDRALLFSGPSGTGKTTQACLWEHYENAEILNGDRTAVRRVRDRWVAYGLPLAGSSKIYKNDSSEIAAIVIIKKSSENQLQIMEPSKAFISLYSETLIQIWDTEFQREVIDLIICVCQSVPVFCLQCRPDRDAVNLLKMKLEELHL